MNVLTLAMPRMNQMIDSLSPHDTKRYLHHYNMAPWANGETGRVGSPKRREIGHGALAARAVLPVIPNQEDFAYTLRLVSEVMSSNGSTSMASVCSSSLSLMDAGVPTKGHVSGIAMGLIYEDGKYITLTDILGSEDAFGDMDFKVAGPKFIRPAARPGSTASPPTCSPPRWRGAHGAARDPEVANAYPGPCGQVAETAPRSRSTSADKVGGVIGPKARSSTRSAGRAPTSTSKRRRPRHRHYRRRRRVGWKGQGRHPRHLTRQAGTGFTTAGSWCHQVRWVRQHPPGRGGLVHLELGAASGSTPSRTRCRSVKRSSARRRDRYGQDQPRSRRRTPESTATHRRATAHQRRPPGRRAHGGGPTATRDRTVDRTATWRGSASRTASTPAPQQGWATSVEGEPSRVPQAAAMVAVGRWPPSS